MSSNHKWHSESIDFVENNPTSFKDAYFDFASIRTFTAAEIPFTPPTYNDLKGHWRSFDSNEF